MSTLTKEQLERRLNESDITKRLVITPILSQKQIGDSSIDLRLGNQFIVFKMHNFGVFQPYNEEISSRLRKMQERQIVRFGQEFILHPGMLALASTFEYLCVPSDLECQVEGRSSWARVGLQIATASSIEPGFKGVLTLELSNVGTIPIELYPGFRVAQLFVHEAKPPVSQANAGRKYQCPIGPQFSRIYDDQDGKAFTSEP